MLEIVVAQATFHLSVASAPLLPAMAPHVTKAELDWIRERAAAESPTALHALFCKKRARTGKEAPTFGNFRYILKGKTYKVLNGVPWLHFPSFRPEAPPSEPQQRPQAPCMSLPAALCNTCVPASSSSMGPTYLRCPLPAGVASQWTPQICGCPLQWTPSGHLINVGKNVNHVFFD